MVDDVKDITETAESKASQEAADRGRIARERREAEQRKRLDELRAHAAAAQAQREKRDEDRRRRQAEQRARDDDRRVQVEERKRAIWEASVSRREALLQRERDRSERLERQRAARSAPRPAFAFGSSTPRLLEPLDSGGFFWAARSTNPIDQMNFFESLAASTTNVMFASAPLTRRASALQLDSSDTDNKDEPDRQPAPVMWSSVARRRTDLVPTLPAPRAPGRAYSMTRLDRLPHSPALHHNTQSRSGETTPSRPGSALSAAAHVLRRPATAPRKPRPASIAGTGVNTPRGGVGETLAQSAATTPTVSRDSTVVGTGSVTRRPASTPRRPRPASMHTTTKPATPVAPGEGKPPLHRKPKPSKEHDRTPRGKSASASPGRALSPSPPRRRDLGRDSRDKELHKTASNGDKREVSAAEVTHKLEALQIQNGEHNADKMTTETQDAVAEAKITETKPEASPTQDEQTQETSKAIEKKEEVKSIEKMEQTVEEVKTPEEVKPVNKQEEEKSDKEAPKPVEKKEERREDKKEPSVEKTDDNEMTASMTARRITTEEEAKAALAERRRRAREELERQAELERQRLQREAEEEAERARLEREREMREEQEASELAQLQRRMEEEKLRRAIEAQQQLEREEAERKAREEAERQAKVKEEEEKRKAAEEAEKQRKEEAEREEKERLARKQRVEAIMARTRLKKAEEDKKQQESKQSSLPNQTEPPVESKLEPLPGDNGAGAGGADSSRHDNGNVATDDLLGFGTQPEPAAPAPIPATLPARVEDGSGDAPQNNGNLTADLLGLSQQTISENKTVEVPTTKTTIDNTTTIPTESNNGNLHTDNAPQLSSNVPANLSANFIQNEIATNESQTKIADNLILDEDFATHNGHGTLNHPLTLQNAI